MKIVNKENLSVLLWIYAHSLHSHSDAPLQVVIDGSFGYFYYYYCEGEEEHKKKSKSERGTQTYRKEEESEHKIKKEF